MFFSSLRSDHLERTIILKTEQTGKDTKHRQKTRSTSKEPPSSPQQKKSRVTAAFQSGVFPPFPPELNCLFSSQVVLCLLFSGVVAVQVCVPTCSVGEEMSANVVVFFDRSVGEDVSPLV